MYLKLTDEFIKNLFDGFPEDNSPLIPSKPGEALVKYDTIVFSADKVVFSFKGIELFWYPVPHIDTGKGETLTVSRLTGVVELKFSGD